MTLKEKQNLIIDLYRYSNLLSIIPFVIILIAVVITINNVVPLHSILVELLLGVILLGVTIVLILNHKKTRDQKTSDIHEKIKTYEELLDIFTKICELINSNPHPRHLELIPEELTQFMEGKKYPLLPKHIKKWLDTYIEKSIDYSENNISIQNISRGESNKNVHGTISSNGFLYANNHSNHKPINNIGNQFDIVDNTSVHPNNKEIILIELKHKFKTKQIKEYVFELKNLLYYILDIFKIKKYNIPDSLI